LEKQIGNLKKYPDYGDLQDDNTQELVDFENNMSAEENLSVVLKKVNKALLAIEKGEYGRCRLCKNAIEDGRLSAIPSADICVTCQSKNKA